MRRRTTSEDCHRLDAEEAVLPEGVTERQWLLEMERSQNPRIRALLGCLRRLSRVFESNVAILNCSPARLAEMWATIRDVATLIRDELEPLLAEASVIPELDASRCAVAANLGHLDGTLLRQIDGFPERVPPSGHDELRRFLCVAMGQMHAFLQDSFGSLMAADPRGRHDADYYLSKEFPRDVEESEWLYASVLALDADFRDVELERRRLVPPFLEHVAGRRRFPAPDQWSAMESFLRHLASDFAARLRAVLSLRAIRLTELDLLSHHAIEIPITCRILIELYESGRQSVGALSFVRAAPDSSGIGERMISLLEATGSGRLIPHTRALDDSLRDLGAFIPIWRQGISQRRALVFRSARRSGPTTDRPGSEPLTPG